MRVPPKSNLSCITQFFLFFILALVLSAGACGQAEQPPNESPSSSALSDIIQIPARLVWVKDTGPTDRVDVYARGEHLVLMGLDTRDGRGERTILAQPSNYSKPLITPDGQRIIYSRLHDHTIHIVNWDGSGEQKLAPGFAMAVWRDPLTKRDWVYAGSDRDKKINQPTFRKVSRFALDDPSVRETIWDQTPMAVDNFQLSADGRLASGGFPWPHCGVAELPNISYERLGRGCWTSLTPDDSLVFWIFDGAHRSLNLFSLRDGSRWQVNVSRAPGIDRGEVYHPRWSNHSRFMVMTGPHFKVGAKRMGGTESEIFVGRFNRELTTIEHWARATFNDRGDFYPDLWIDPAGHEKWTVADVPGPASASVQKNIPEYASWPGEKTGIVFFWEDASKDSQLRDPETGKTLLFRLEPHGLARLGRHFEMDLRNGYFLAEDDATRHVIEHCRQTNEISLEAMITPMNKDQRGPARIMTLSSGNPPRNMLLGQERDKLVLRLRTNEPGQGRPRQLELARLHINEPQHVAVTYRPGQLHAYVNGELVFSADALQGGLDDWTEQPLLFGDEWGGNRDWDGLLEAVSIYNRVLEPVEIQAKYKAVMQRLQGRKPPQQSIVKARLIQTSSLPTPQDIAPYRAALVVNAYRVEQVLSGDLFEGKKILAAHWAIMDEKVLDTAVREQDQVYRMTLELFENRPELEGERLAMDTDDLLLPLYLDVDS